MTTYQPNRPPIGWDAAGPPDDPADLLWSRYLDECTENDVDEGAYDRWYDYQRVVKEEGSVPAWMWAMWHEIDDETKRRGG